MINHVVTGFGLTNKSFENNTFSMFNLDYLFGQDTSSLPKQTCSSCNNKLNEADISTCYFPKHFLLLFCELVMLSPQ